jgi:hypothetical protein
MPFKDKDKKLEWQRKNRQKKRQSPVKTEPEPTEPTRSEEPKEPLVPQDEELSEFELNRFPIKNQDCLTFRKMISGDISKDGFFCGNHDVICPSCNQWRIYLEHGEESDFPKAHADPFHASGEPPEDLEFLIEKPTRTPNPDVEKYNPKYPIEEHEPKTEQPDEPLVPQQYIDQTFQRKQKQQPETQDDNQAEESEGNDKSTE